MEKFHNTQIFKKLSKIYYPVEKNTSSTGQIPELMLMS